MFQTFLRAALPACLLLQCIASVQVPVPSRVPGHANDPPPVLTDRNRATDAASHQG